MLENYNILEYGFKNTRNLESFKCIISRTADFSSGQSLLVKGLVFANTEHNLSEEIGFFFFQKKGAYK